MQNILNIVNSDPMIKRLQKADIPGTFLAWDDLLHEGAVPEHLSLERLSYLRAQHLANIGIDSFESIHQRFKQRNATLHSYRKYRKVILWFEHDLYDQLQLIQILDWFGKYGTHTKGLYLIQYNHSLLHQSNAQLRDLLLYHKETVMHNHLIVARKAWSAFRATTPEAWFKLQEDDTSALPFLKNIVIRLLEEYPNTINGLSRSAHQALLIIAKGTTYPPEIYTTYQSTEQTPFMGDLLFWRILKSLRIQGALKTYDEGKTLYLTPLGEQLLQGKIDWINLTKPIDYWIGGVHQKEPTIWRWDIHQQHPRCSC